jgi:hypothetical protein
MSLGMKGDNGEWQQLSIKVMRPRYGSCFKVCNGLALHPGRARADGFLKHLPFSASLEFELAAWGLLLEIALLVFWPSRGVARLLRLIAGFLLPSAVFCLATWRVLAPARRAGLLGRSHNLVAFARSFTSPCCSPHTRFPTTFTATCGCPAARQRSQPYSYPPARSSWLTYRTHLELIFNRDVLPATPIG